MRAAYRKDTPALRFATPGTRIFVLGGLLLVLSAVSYGLQMLLSAIQSNGTQFHILTRWLDTPIAWSRNVFVVSLILSAALAVFAALISLRQSPSSKIRCMVRRGLFDSRQGNPLHLKDGEILPHVTCKVVGFGAHLITITAGSATIDAIQDASPSISTSLNRKRFQRYAVVEAIPDLGFNQVVFRVQDVEMNRTITANTVDKLCPSDPAKLMVQQGTVIDLTTSGSVMVAGKTRSGKTTGIIGLLLQALQWGRDNHGSEMMIIDPKQAELSQLPHVYTLGDDGGVAAIFDAIKRFADTATKRQKTLNSLSAETGDVVKWWEAGMHVSLLFIDEYIALRSMLPKRTAKDSTDCNLELFDNSIKRIVTMGASAGCYVIISIAEASVDSGGIPAMLRSAMSTKILFKPTLPEARLMWDSEKLKDFPARTYNAGDAWFSSTDGIHDNVSYVHFPIMTFPIYAELGKLLTAYYAEE